MVEFVYENPTGLNRKLIDMTIYVGAHQHELSPSPFPIGKRLKPFWCQAVTFTSHKVNHFWWQMCTTCLHLNEEGRKRERKKLEQKRSLRGEPCNSLNSKQNLRHLLKSACEQRLWFCLNHNLLIQQKWWWCRSLLHPGMGTAIFLVLLSILGHTWPAGILSI